LIKKTITYTSPFTEQQVTEDHYFHISKADLVEMELEEHNARYRNKEGEELSGMQAHLQRIIDAEDGKAVLKEFKAILRRAYGKKDGDRFVKNEETWREFEGSEAYSELVYELLTNADELAVFINKLVPAGLDRVAAEVAARADSEQVGQREVTSLEERRSSTIVDQGDWTVKRRPVLDAATSENPVVLTRVDIVELDDETFKSGIAEGRFKLA
jgi:hypothetical protein